MYLSNRSNIQKILDGELFIRILSTTLLEIVGKSMLHSKVILKSLTGPDDTGQVGLQPCMGQDGQTVGYDSSGTMSTMSQVV